MAFPAIAQQGRRLRNMAFATGQTYKEGAALILSSGELIIAPNAAGAVATIGFAAEDAAPTASDSRVVDVTPGETLVAVGHASATFLMELWATDTRVEPDVANIGVGYGILIDATNGAFFVDEDDTTNDAVTVVDIVLKDPIPQQDGVGAAIIQSLVEVKLVNPYG